LRARKPNGQNIMTTIERGHLCLNQENPSFDNKSTHKIGEFNLKSFRAFKIIKKVL